MKADQRVNFEEDWKLVTVLVGGNDLCEFSCTESSFGDPDTWVANVTSLLDYLQQELPRTLVNLVQIPDIVESFSSIRSNRNQDDNSGGGTCTGAGLGERCMSYINRLCPCGPHGRIALNNHHILNHTSEVARQYQAGLVELINSSRYNTGDNFTVVLQPFLTQTLLPKGSNGLSDLSSLAFDCFHWSPQGHRVAAVNLWNNMFQSVGEKKAYVDYNPTIFCPTDDDPYIQT